MKESATVCGRLALERCKYYVNHIHAVLFMCKEKQGEGLDETATESIQRLTTLLGMELGRSYDLIVQPDDPPL